MHQKQCNQPVRLTLSGVRRCPASCDLEVELYSMLCCSSLFVIRHPSTHLFNAASHRGVPVEYRSSSTLLLNAVHQIVMSWACLFQFVCILCSTMAARLPLLVSQHLELKQVTTSNWVNIRGTTGDSGYPLKHTEDMTNQLHNNNTLPASLISHS